ncbi:MAG TPA: HPF/RaiA family ribosome-associated protein [candidate division Zixibacteria bacterium]|nr:HPF/RaiA family ribosome-associated protein [candidate division Zixibacteria bacterium]
MEVPLELTLRDIKKTDELVDLVNDKVASLEKVCDYIISCRIALEKPQEHQRMGNPYRVRVNVRVPPGHEIVVKREPGDGDMHEPLDAVIRDVFSAAQRQLKELVEKQRNEVKVHPDQEVAAVIERIFKDEGYGFLKTIEGREVYFNESSLVNDRLEDLEPGMGVRFVGALSDAGFQASTVQVVDKPSGKTE